MVKFTKMGVARAWRGALAGVAIIGLTLLAPVPAKAWWVGPRVVVPVPPVVVGPPVVYAAPPPVYYAPPPHRHWIPGHWRGPYWVPGHWVY